MPLYCGVKTLKIEEGYIIAARYLSVKSIVLKCYSEGYYTTVSIKITVLCCSFTMPI